MEFGRHGCAVALLARGVAGLDGYGIETPYEKLKELTRGKRVDAGLR